MNVHNTNKKPFECPKCQTRFATSSALDRHDITMHSGLVETTNNGEARKPKCMICNREFPSQESLSSHLKCHKEELKFVEFACDLCPKTFQKLNQLTRHSKTHVENKNIQCNLCGKMFSSGSHLVNHLNLHKGKSKLSIKCPLKSHYNFLGIKLHSCPLCDKSFSQSCSLKDHIRYLKKSNYVKLSTKLDFFLELTAKSDRFCVIHVARALTITVILDSMS